ncbi:MAG: transposase [Thermoleophilia bacterium]|nr:transposase [Thermoleophilia bacterium]
MARAPRVQVEGGTFHVTAHAIAGARLYRGPDDLSLFLELTEQAVRGHGWACYAFCLMPNHYHLLIETPHRNLAEGIKWVNGCYAQRFNGRHGTRGHVFGSRYDSALIEREAHVLEAIRYIALNPVRAGLCAEPIEWKWSSYAAMIGDAPAPSFLALPWVLQLFDADRALARDQIRNFVLDGLGR